MFIRKRRNRSGSTSIVVVNKRHGQFVEVRNFGTAETDDDINKLYAQAHKWLMSNGGQQSIDFDDLKGREYEETRRVIDNMDAAMINGTQLLLTQIYDSIGFDRIHDDVLRHLVIARVSQPMSKLATVEYLKSYYDEDVDLNRIYRYMDRLYKTQQELVQNISVEHTRKILGGRIGLMFYDVSTLYFETSMTDNLREPGFSKDGKTAESQVVLGLLVSEGGYPLSYSLFNGSQYEGYTMLPIIDDFKQRFNLGDDFVVVADSGLMSTANVKLLRSAGYKYIIGARIKSESKAVKEWILSHEKRDGHYFECKRDDGERLIVGYSDKRAKKDAYNRSRGVADQYHGLWVVEKAFRVSKGTLDMRPMFHFTERRIEAHVCICFVAYKVYKELERIIKLAGINMSISEVLKTARTIITVRVNMPENKDVYVKTLFLTKRQKAIEPLFKLSNLGLE